LSNELKEDGEMNKVVVKDGGKVITCRIEKAVKGEVFQGLNESNK